MKSLSLDGLRYHACGGRYERTKEPMTIRVSGMSATVDRVVLRCVKCDHEERTADHREEAERATWLSIRKTHGLLAPREIRRLRERIGLTHEQVGELLYGTPKGIVEGWERGRYLQNQQVDEMLRSLEDPATLERLAAKAGVALKSGELGVGDGEFVDGEFGDGKVGGEESGVESDEANLEGAEPGDENLEIEGGKTESKIPMSNDATV